GDELASGMRAESDLELDERRALVWAHGIAGMVQAAGDWWLDHPEVSREQMVEELTALVFGAFTGAGAAATG
ncbi:MAG TPA: hypothetical protein VKJ07_25470, partial [Mycobacteriales bacterium]|nr:hypothetical protein [Mycobacteriales bacterium]